MSPLFGRCFVRSSRSRFLRLRLPFCSWIRPRAAPLAFAYAAGMGLTAAPLAPAHAAADIALSTAIVDFAPGKPAYQDVAVANRGNETAYVGVSVELMQDPGTDASKKRALTKDEAKELVVVPRRMVVPPGGRKLVRFISRHKKLPSDKIYQAVVKPVPPEHKQEGRLGVQVVVAYGVLIFVRPPKLDIKLEGSRQGKLLTLKNAGNTNVLVQRTEQCTTVDGKEICKPVDTRRLYPGNSGLIELPFDGPVQLTYQVAGEYHAKVFK